MSSPRQLRIDGLHKRLLSRHPQSGRYRSSPIPHIVATQQLGWFDGLFEDCQSPQVRVWFRTVCSGRQPVHDDACFARAYECGLRCARRPSGSQRVGFPREPADRGHRPPGKHTPVSDERPSNNCSRFLPQTLSRLPVSRRLGYRGIGFALSVATYQGWLPRDQLDRQRTNAIFRCIGKPK